jgi:serine/threonine protein kinase/tetratricopeptide (TPR) repeat protein
MVCPQCRTETPLTSGRCVACTAELSLAGLTITGAGVLLSAHPTLPSVPSPDLFLSATSSLAPGDRFAGRYRVERLLGAGGMGAVYKAHDEELGIPIALKVIRSEMLGASGAGAEFEMRFKQELLLARQVTHQNVVRIHDLGDFRGVKYITMPFIAGSDLYAILAEGKLPVDRLLSLAAQLAAGLAAAHDVGIVHRDLKPQNIMVDGAGRAYISDFGLAKSFEATAIGLTRPGDFLGTPRYMAPESVEGQPSDQRSDLYALGLILYEAASGAPAFPGESAMEVLMQRVRVVPKPLKSIAPDVPAYFSDIVMRCLERDPAARYQNARAIVTDLDAGRAPVPLRRATSLSINVPLPSTKRGRMAAAMVALVLIVPLAWLPPVRRVFSGETSDAQALPSPAVKKLIAVLPFRFSGNADLAHVATGIADALSAKLFSLDQVTVAPSSAVEAANLTPPVNLKKLARELGSNLIVRGSVQGTATRISITVQVEDPMAPRQLWTHEFSGDPADLLTLQEQIFNGLIEALDITPSNEQRAKSIARPTDNVAAYDLYLKGRNAMRGQQDKRNVQAALDFYQSALTTDPKFALAFAGLADASLQMYRETKERIWADKAVFAAQQGQRLDDSLLEVRVASGAAYLATGKTQEAIAELRRALELAPNSDEVYRRLAAAYGRIGQNEQSIEMHLKAIETNPYYWLNHNALGGTYFRIGDYAKAAEEFRKVISIEPDNVNGFNDLGAAYLQTASYKEAAQAFKKALALVPTADTWSNLGIAYAWQAQFKEALPAYQKAVELSPGSDAWLSNLADDYRWLGDQKRAAATYDKAIALAYQALTVDPTDATTRCNLGTYYAKKGDTAQGLKMINEALAGNRTNPGFLYNLAVAHTLAGQHEPALQALRAAFKAGYPPAFSRNDPDLKGLSADPRFTALTASADPTK